MIVRKGYGQGALWNKSVSLDYFKSLILAIKAADKRKNPFNPSLI